MTQKRPPVVVVLGSVDHGKTTLLDYIRKTNVAAKETGSITQSVGAYEIVHLPQNDEDRTQTNAETIPRQSALSQRAPALSEGKKITFIDTPGHEAFFHMRSRGAKIADVAILMVAADDSVKPQTKEAIKIIQAAKIPYVAAINKIDKQPEITKVKNDLMQAGVLLEGYGGNVSYQPISAKTGQGVNELLDLILLTAEVEDLKYDPDKKAEGFILESKLDSRRGIIAAAIIKDGTLKVGDEIAAGEAGGKVRTLENFLGKRIEQASACAPVLILGFNSLPKVGEEFMAGKPAMAAAAPNKVKASGAMAAKDKDSLKLILKGDVSGSVEALAEVIKNLLVKERSPKIIDESVGDISDGDVNLAISTGAIIVGFKVKSTKAADNLARANKVEIIQSDIIYELLKVLEERLISIKEKILGKLQILAIFSKKNKKQVVGGKVVEGEIRANAILHIERNGERLDQGRVLNIQHNKKDVTRVEAGKECGLFLESELEVQVGDALIQL